MRTCYHYDKKRGKMVAGMPPRRAVPVSMFPYRSTNMAVDPGEVAGVQERLRKDDGLSVDFDSSGRPEVTSTLQQDALAKAMGMKTGRDGYGHIDEHGNFQNSGRRRTAEMQEGRGHMRKAIHELKTMPVDAPPNAVMSVLEKHNIRL